MKNRQYQTGNGSVRKLLRILYLPTAFTLVAVSTLLAPIPGCSTPNSSVDEQTDADKESAIDLMYDEYRADFPDAPEIDVEELLTLRETQDVLIVDVREPQERAVSIIPGAISRESFESMKESLKKGPIVVHCTIGYRSGKYVEKLKAEGIEAHNLKGSILSWVHAGQPVVDPEGNQTKRVHVYGERWNLLPKGYEAVW